MSEVREIIQECKRKGIEIYIENNKLKYRTYKNAISDEIFKMLRKNKNEIIEYLVNQNNIETENSLYEPFPLSTVQSAYLLGRGESYSFGNTSCYIYQEYIYKEKLDKNKVENIWNELISKHPMLRTVINNNSTQQTIKKVETFKVLEGDTNKLRDLLENKIYPLKKWPMFDIGISEKNDGSILHFSMDFMIADWSSIWFLLSEFESAYFDGKEPKGSDYSFREYCIQKYLFKNKKKYIEDRAFWSKKLDTINTYPILPTINRLNVDEKNDRFIRFSTKLGAEEWRQLKKTSSCYGLTPNSVLLAIYALSLMKWSSNKKFTINYTVLSNAITSEDHCVGDFTETSLISIDDFGKTFLALATSINRNIFENIDHSSYSGVEVMRDIARQKNIREVLLPYVFTSAVGTNNNKLKGNYGYGITQTPQVFIDCQCTDNIDGLEINWDVRENIFKLVDIKNIFSDFKAQLYKYSSNPLEWENRICSDTTNRLTKNEDSKLLNLNIFGDDKFINDPENKEMFKNISEYIFDKENCEEIIISVKNSNKINRELDISIIQSPKESSNGIEHINLDDIDKYNERLETELQTIEYKKVFNLRDNLALSCILKALLNLRVLTKDSKYYRYVGNIEKNVDEKYEWILDRWISELVSYNVLIDKGNALYKINTLYKTEEFDKNWHTLYSLWRDEFGDIEIINYIKDNLDKIEDILKGVTDPVELLYPKGLAKYTNALYKNSINSIIINNYFCQFIKKYVSKNSSKSLQILEIGAGTGASTEKILGELGENKYKYYFTDSLKYFLPLAKKKYGENQDVIIKQFNADIDPYEQGFLPNQFDLVIGAYVLENVQDIKKTLKYLKKIISPNGYLLFSEPVRNEPWIMGSQIFMMEPPQDKIREKRFFIEPNEWAEILDDIEPSTKSFLLPKEGSILLNHGAIFIAKKFKNNYSKIDVEEINNIIQDSYKGIFSSVKTRYFNELTRTEKDQIISGKIQIDLYTDNEESQHTIENIEKLNDTEKILIAIINDEFGDPRISSSSNLYDHGADSLLLARVATKIISKIKTNLTFEAVLRELIREPTIRSLAVFLDRVDDIESEIDDHKKLLVSKLYKSYSTSDTLSVIFQGPLGNISDIEYFAKQLQIQNNGNVMVLGIDDYNKFLNTSNEDVIPVLAQEAAEEIFNQKIKNVKIIGYSFGGHIAIEVSRYLLERGVNVLNLSIIESGSIPNVHVDNIILEFIYLNNYGVSLSDLGLEKENIISEEFSDTKNSNITINSIKNHLNNLNDRSIINKVCNSSEDERFEIYTNVLYKKTGVLLEKGKILEKFKIFKKTFNVQKQTPSPYFGNINYYIAKDNDDFFAQSFKLLKLWENAILGEIKVDYIGGNHFSCIVNHNLAKELAIKLGKECKNDEN